MDIKEGAPVPEPVSKSSRRRLLGGFLAALGTVVGIKSSSFNQGSQNQLSSESPPPPSSDINIKAVLTSTPEAFSITGISKDRVLKVTITPTPVTQQSILVTNTPESPSAQSTSTLQPSPTPNIFETQVAELTNKLADVSEPQKLTAVAKEVANGFFTQEQVLKAISDLTKAAFGANIPANFDRNPVDLLNGQRGLQNFISLSGVNEVIYKRIEPRLRSSVELSLSDTPQIFKAQYGGQEMTFNLLTADSIEVFIPDLSDPTALGIESYFAVESLVRIRDAWGVILENDFPDGLAIKNQNGQEIQAGSPIYDQAVMSFAYNHYQNLPDNKQLDFKYSESDLNIVYSGALATTSIMVRNLEERGWKNPNNTELLREIAGIESFYKNNSLNDKEKISYVKRGNVWDLSDNIWTDQKGKNELLEYLQAGRRNKTLPFKGSS